MADIFSSHPYKRFREVKPDFHYCEACEKSINYRDKMVHERGKKHAAKVLEKNPPTETAFDAEPVLTGNECHNCGQPGHRKTECTNERKNTGTCNNCQKVGHMRKDCPDKRPDECFNCGEVGHRKPDCPNPRVPMCRNCDERGHIAKECPKPKDWSRVKCENCGEMGHTKVRCTTPPAEVADDGWDDNAGVSDAADGGWESGAAVASDANGRWENAVVTVTAADGDTPSWDATPVVHSEDEDDDVPTSAPAEVSW